MGSVFKTWLWRMALRDGRRGLSKLLLSMSCVVLGVASVVAVSAFRENLAASVQEQSKTLLGADLAIVGRQPFSEEAEALIASLGGEQSRQIGFSSMAYFPGSGLSRLVQVRALSGAFPYYGTLETEPAPAAKSFQDGPNALVDETLMLQFNAGVGDHLKIGEQEFRIAGKLRKIPGETLAFSLLSPRVYIPLEHLDQSQLLQRGSIVRYRVYFKLDPGVDVDGLVRSIAPELRRLHLESDTVRRRQAAISGAMENLSRYLQLAVFIAVLLAGVGVASGIQVYVREKTASVAVLRCIGATPGETVWVYIIQAAAIAVAGSLLGAMIGIALQALLPLAFRDFLPVESGFSLAPKGILLGLGVGLATSLLFSLLPLVPLRKISPLLALRSSYEKSHGMKDPLIWLILFIIAAAILGFGFVTTGRRLHALGFAAAVAAAFALLVFIARGVSVLLKKIAPEVLPYAWRQGLANLHRPKNQTTAVMLSIGLGTFLLVTLYSIQSMLVNQIAERSSKGEPNLVLFDVQPDQREGIGALFSSFDVGRYEEVPIVTMRLAAVKGRKVEELRAEAKIPVWTLRREYRSTYRSGLTGTERIVEGTWVGRVDGDSTPIPVSLEREIAESLNVTLDDQLEFELQGVPLTTRVAAIREVDWQRVQPNFFVVFPEGVLESAPQFYAVVAHTDSSELSAGIQRAVVETFPNVSMIDLTLVLSTLDAILGRVSNAIRFIALFTILTGFSVLAGAVLSSRTQRIREAILLKTLGAARGQIVSTIVAEYLFLGMISGATGALLGVAASWGLSFYFLETVASISPAPIVWILALVTAATVVAGIVGCWGIFRRPALEALRAEA